MNSTRPRPPGARSALRVAETAEVHASQAYRNVENLLNLLVARICPGKVTPENFVFQMRILTSELSQSRFRDPTKDIKKELVKASRPNDGLIVDKLSNELKRYLKYPDSVMSFLHKLSSIRVDSSSPSRIFAGLPVMPPSTSHQYPRSVPTATPSTLMPNSSAPSQTPMGYGNTTTRHAASASSAATTVQWSNIPQQYVQTQSQRQVVPNVPNEMEADAHVHDYDNESEVKVNKVKMDTIDSKLRWTRMPVAVGSVPETALVKDVVYCLQGVNGTYMVFDESTNQFVLARDPETNATIRNIPAATFGSLASEACTPGALYRRILEGTADRKYWESRGLVSQAIWAAIQSELGMYVNAVAELGAQADAAPHTVTLRRVVVWGQEPTRRLGLINSILPLCSQFAGGALLSRLCVSGRGGDPLLHKLVSDILAIAGQPMLEMIRKWITEGDRQDPYNEFFVMSDPSVRDSQLWSRKYSVRPEMIPEGFVDMTMAGNIMLVGKSINFLRRCCGDSGFFLEVDWASDFDFEYGDSAALKSRVLTAKQLVSKQIMTTLEEKYHLSVHMDALKKYMLLGQGDFIQRLMDLLHDELAKPASELLRHHLGGVLEHARRQSNAQFEDIDVIKRLDFRILQGSPGDSGWDVFSLDYSIGADTVNPLHTILPSPVMNSYRRIFAFLWRLRAAEHALNESWRTHMNSARIASELIPSYVGLAGILRRCYVTRSEMVHLVRQLQYYVMFEVLEVSWGKLLVKLANASTLDDLLQSHQQFLNEVLQKGLLTKAAENTMSLIRKVLDVCVRFRHAQDKLAESLEAEAAHLEDVASTVYERTQAGKWGLTTDDGQDAAVIMGEARSLVPAATQTLSSLEREFSSTLQALRTSLGEKTGLLTPLPGTSPQAFAERMRNVGSNHVGDDDELDNKEMRYLAFRLDFNSFYSSKDSEWSSESNTNTKLKDLHLRT